MVNRNRAVCIQPFLMAEGYVIFDVAIGDEKYNWKGKYFVGTSTERRGVFKCSVLVLKFVFRRNPSHCGGTYPVSRRSDAGEETQRNKNHLGETKSHDEFRRADKNIALRLQGSYDFPRPRVHRCYSRKCSPKNAFNRCSGKAYTVNNIVSKHSVCSCVQESIPNSGEYVIDPTAFEDRDNIQNLDLTFGFLQIQLINPTVYSGISISP